MRGATHHAGRRCDCGAIISIHAPHARSDRTMHIGGSDRSQFQSTLLMRGATRLPSTARASAQNFNPRSSCEERQFYDYVAVRSCQISIHAPHARSDAADIAGTMKRQISIHAPHARSDLFISVKYSSNKDFNPRSSCEERRSKMPMQMAAQENFNPRSSCEERPASS